MTERVVDALPRAQAAKSRLLITLVVDTSSSMAENGGIFQLNTALQNWRGELQKDPFVARVGEIALITFGNNHVTAIDASGRPSQYPAQPFVPVRAFDPPALAAGGVTPMVEALQFAFEVVAARKQQLRSEGVLLANRPLVYLLTDGAPTDQDGHRTDRWRDLAPVIRQHEAGKHLLFFAIGVSGADQDVLRGLAPKSHYQLSGLEFGRVLQLVSSSIESVAQAPSRDQPADLVYDELASKHDRIRDWMNERGSTSVAQTPSRDQPAEDVHDRVPSKPDRIRDWMKQSGSNETGWRLGTQPEAPVSGNGAAEGPDTEGEEVREGSSGPETTAGELAPATRWLAVDLPERVSAGRRISLLVRITITEPAWGRASPLMDFDVPPEGRPVTITVSAPGLIPRDDLRPRAWLAAGGR